MFSFNIICTSIGRTTLPRLIESFKEQLNENDIFTIISDINHAYVSEVLKLFFSPCVANLKCKAI